jgi:hypothetical protein
MIGETCGVRIFGPRAQHHCCEHGCDKCQVGCFNPARYKNPFFGGKFYADDHHYWWRWCYSYTEFLCAEHYDDMVDEMKGMEDFYRDSSEHFVEDPEFTAILKTL